MESDENNIFESILFQVTLATLNISQNVVGNSIENSAENSIENFVETENSVETEDSDDSKTLQTLRLYVDVSLEDVHRGACKRISYFSYSKRRGCTEKNKRRVYISLRDVDVTREFVFPGQGDEVDGRRADLVVDVNILDHPLYRIDDILDSKDICVTINLPIYDYFYGKTFELTHLDGSQLLVEYEPQSTNRVRILDSLGLLREDGTRGNLNVFFDLTVPKIDQKLISNPIYKAMLWRLFR